MKTRAHDRARKLRIISHVDLGHARGGDGQESAEKASYVTSNDGSEDRNANAPVVVPAFGGK
jgi:hypothetical protein